MIPTPTQHPLHRDGTSQAARNLEDLRPDRSLLDDRGLDDLLEYLRLSAGLLVHYDLTNTSSGDWEPFLSKYPAVRLAAIAHHSTARLRTSLEAQIAAINPASTVAALAACEALFQLLAAELVRINGWTALFQTNADYSRALERAISSHLKPALRTTISAIKAVVADSGSAWLDPVIPQLNHTAWSSDELNAVTANPALAGLDEVARLSELKSALSGLADELLQALTFLAKEAERVINEGGLETTDQPPHLGLILAYLRLFKHAQGAVNDLVRRHLEFYFRLVLRIQARPAVMDRLYVQFEPARNVTSHRLDEGTRLFAGKDSKKAEIQFGLVREFILNQASIAELRSVFVDAATNQRLLAAPVAKSSDGQGAELSDEDPTWPPFGHSGLAVGRHGFAIAAPVLRLTGGQKEIKLRLTLSASAASTLDSRCQDAEDRGGGSLSDGQWTLAGLVGASLTTPDGWLVLDSTRVQASFTPAQRIVDVQLGPLSVDEIVSPYDAATHQRAFATEWPVVEITRTEASSLYPGAFLDDLVLEKVEVECVVTDDVNLVVANDAGSVDLAKPFLPFGATPTVALSGSTGSSFYVGSPEIFANQLTRLYFDVEWKDLPTAPTGLATYFVNYVTAGTSTAFKVAASYLVDAKWQALRAGTDLDLFAAPLEVDSDALATFPSDPDLPAFTSLEAGRTRGFVKFTLTSPSFGFGHKAYPGLYTNAVIIAVRDRTTVTGPAAPFAPAISRIAAGYTAVESREFGNSTEASLEFFHVEPHGEWRADNSDEVELVPKQDFDGAFFIGVEGLEANQQVSLLFHLADGSGDPFVDYPEVAWEVLAGSEWQAFETTEILHDSTLQLRRTGLTLFTVPAEATREHTRMPTGRVWLRAVARGKVEALNRAYDVLAQAAEAEFVNQGNDLSRLAAPLPAESVTRLVSSQPEVKKVTQSLASFGGEVEEAGPSYYRRVSERLRHRGRAVTLWDYERLVLQEFPALHKVKCVPHATPDPYSALAPGHVMVVVVPKLTADAFNPLQPASSQDVLEEVEEFLSGLATSFAQIKVVNPLYEEVQVVGSIRLKADYDPGLYETQIQEDLIRFLTPWAYGEAGALSFTAELYPSVLLNFLDEREYVDYVSDFQVRQFVGGQPLSPDPTKLSPTTERSILVSHIHHEITLV